MVLRKLPRKWGPPLCAKCQKPIYDGNIFKAKDQFYHNACLQCISCQKPLRTLCFAKGNDFYCSGDFTRLFGAKCSGCSGIIPPTETVRFVNGYLYHSTCFTCAICRRPVKTGDFFYMRQDMKLVCETDYNSYLEKVTGDPGDSDSDDGGIMDCIQRQRTCINDNQLRMLTSSYQSDARPSRQMIDKLSRKTGLRPRVVRIWFQNRRAKEKHAVHEISCESQTTEMNKHEDCAYTGSTANAYSDMSLTSARGYHHSNTTEVNQSYQLYWPLDYIQPDSMPPNIDLSSTDLRNGEVISPKVKESLNCQFSVPTYMQDTTNTRDVPIDRWYKM